MRLVRQTEKQKAIMGLVMRRAGEGVFLSIKEIYEQMPHAGADPTGNGSSYGAVRLSIYQLEKATMIERKRVGRVTQIVPTAESYHWFLPR